MITDKLENYIYVRLQTRYRKQQYIAAFFSVIKKNTNKTNLLHNRQQSNTKTKITLLKHQISLRHINRSVNRNSMKTYTTEIASLLTIKTNDNMAHPKRAFPLCSRSYPQFLSTVIFLIICSVRDMEQTTSKNPVI